MRINKEKTEGMVCSKDDHVNCNLSIQNKDIQMVKEFKYLGAIITKDAKCKRDIRNRISMAKRAFYNKKQLFTTKNMSIQLRKK